MESSVWRAKSRRSAGCSSRHSGRRLARSSRTVLPGARRVVESTLRDGDDAPERGIFWHTSVARCRASGNVVAGKPRLFRRGPPSAWTKREELPTCVLRLFTLAPRRIAVSARSPSSFSARRSHAGARARTRVTAALGAAAGGRAAGAGAAQGAAGAGAAEGAVAEDRAVEGVAAEEGAAAVRRAVVEAAAEGARQAASSRPGARMRLPRSARRAPDRSPANTGRTPTSSATRCRRAIPVSG
jgi:hypothetical protein